MKTLTKVAVLVITSALLLPTSAMAGNCRNVDITVANASGSEVRINRITHYDFYRQKVRRNFTLPRRLPNGRSWNYRKNLQFVKNELTQISFHYYNSQRRSYQTAVSQPFTCRKGMAVTIRIN